MRALVLIAALAGAAHAENPRPDDAKCRAYLEQGAATKDPVKARALFHTARVRCANHVTLVMIARTYQDAGDLPRMLAYLEAFLAVAEPGHQARPAVEKAVLELQPLVPAPQRVNINDELAAATAAVTAGDSTEDRLAGGVEVIDDTRITTVRPTTTAATTATATPATRVRKLFVGANLAYAPVAKVEVTNDGMTGRSDFSAAFAGELQAGYRLRPFLSLGVVSQLFFNLRPDGEDAATELELFAQATTHVRVAKGWDFDLFGAPGYSVLLVPGDGHPNGLVLRWGGGLVHHVSDRLSVTGELAHQVGFQRARGAQVETSFVSVLFGVRIRP